MSIEITNLTPFPNLRFSNWDQERREFGVFIVKGAFDIPLAGVCRRSSEQEPLVMTDDYSGEINSSSIRYPSDFVPYKPETDVLISATAYAPNGKSARSWDVSLTVEDQHGAVLSQAIRVYGPRYWIPKWARPLKESERANWRAHRKLFLGWELTEAEEITHLDIVYEFAFGGTHAEEVEDGRSRHEVFEPNPVGRGWIHPELTDHTQPVPAPQLEDPDNPVIDPYALYDPVGFGPIAPAWQPRRKLGGTYDQHWLDEIQPYWPSDYDFRYHNSANSKLRCLRHLQGEVKFTLVNMRPDISEWRFSFPHQGVYVIEDVRDGEAGPDELEITYLANDTIFLDVGRSTNADPRLFATWRFIFDIKGREDIFLGQRDPLSPPDHDDPELVLRSTLHPHQASRSAQELQEEKVA